MKLKIAYVKFIAMSLSFTPASPYVGMGQQQQSPSADSTMSERSLVPFALVNLLSSFNNIDVINIFNIYVCFNFMLKIIILICTFLFRFRAWHLFICFNRMDTSVVFYVVVGKLLTNFLFTFLLFKLLY